MMSNEQYQQLQQYQQHQQYQQQQQYYQYQYQQQHQHQQLEHQQHQQIEQHHHQTQQVEQQVEKPSKKRKQRSEKEKEKEKEKKKRQKKDREKQSYESQISSLRQQMEKQQEVIEEYRKAFRQKENADRTFPNANVSSVSFVTPQEPPTDLSTLQEPSTELTGELPNPLSMGLTDTSLTLSPSKKKSPKSKKDKKVKREGSAHESELFDIQQRIVQNFLNLIEELPKCSPVRRPLIKVMSRNISLAEMRKILWISDRTWSRIQSEDERESVIYLKYAMDSTRERVSEEVMTNVKRIIDQILPLSPGKPFRKQARTNQQIYDQYLEECGKERIETVSFSTFYRHMKTLSIHREKPTTT